MAAQLGDSAERAPDKRFLVWAPVDGAAPTLSHGDLWASSGRVAAGLAAGLAAGGLAARGATSGARVLMPMKKNAPELLLAWLASARLGVVTPAPYLQHFGDITEKQSLCAQSRHPP